MFSPLLAGRGGEPHVGNGAGAATKGFARHDDTGLRLRDRRYLGVNFVLGSRRWRQAPRLDATVPVTQARSTARAASRRRGTSWASRDCRLRSTLFCRRARASGRSAVCLGYARCLSGSASQPQYSARAATSRRSRIRPRRRSTSRASSANVIVKFKHSISSRRTRRTASARPPRGAAPRPRARASTSRRGGTSPAPSRPAA